MRKSLRLRLLGFSLAIATLAVVATALLAVQGTGAQLRKVAEGDATLLETDSAIRSSLFAYANEHRSWDEVKPLVRALAKRTGRRIALTTLDGSSITDSAWLLDERPGGRPSNPAARVDASRPAEPLLPDEIAKQTSAGQEVIAYGWQLTDREKRERQRDADRAVACLRRQGIDGTLLVDGGGGEAVESTGIRTFTTTGPTAQHSDQQSNQHSRTQACIPDTLIAPSAASRKLNRRATELTVACLGKHDLPHKVSTDSYGMRLVSRSGTLSSLDKKAWADCRDQASIAAKKPYVAPAALLYLGSSDRFDPFSSEGWWRTAATTAVILALVALVTVLAGRRLVRPIVALTTAAQRMEAGDHAARVQARGNDEVARLARAFNAMAESIERIDRQRRALIGDVAHDLRNPLANIRSHLEAVEYGVVPLDNTLIPSLQEETALLERLVTDLQDLALADAGMLPIYPEERDAADLAGQTVDAHRAQAEVAEVTVRLDAPVPVQVFVDPGRLRQALGNLVDNAITHTAAGGAIDVVVRRNGDIVDVSVTDAGPGIDPEHLPYIFDRFYRADPARSRSTGGSGLGLAIAKHLVEAHRGRLTVTSTPGEGSTFTIELPRHPR